MSKSSVVRPERYPFSIVHCVCRFLASVRDGHPQKKKKKKKAYANAAQKMDETEEVDRGWEAENGTRGDRPMCETGEF